jgi:hypothetical protein
LNVVDSSGWLEFLASGPNVDFFCGPIRNISELIVPAISLYEVYKRLLQQTDKENALRRFPEMNVPGIAA